MLAALDDGGNGGAHFVGNGIKQGFTEPFRFGRKAGLLRRVMEPLAVNDQPRLSHECFQKIILFQTGGVAWESRTPITPKMPAGVAKGR